MSRWPTAILDNQVTSSDRSNFPAASSFLPFSSCALPPALLLSLRNKQRDIWRVGRTRVLHFKAPPCSTRRVDNPQTFPIGSKRELVKDFRTNGGVRGGPQLYTRSLFVRTSWKESGDEKLCHPCPIDFPCRCFPSLPRSYFYSALPLSLPPVTVVLRPDVLWVVYMNPRIVAGQWPREGKRRSSE